MAARPCARFAIWRGRRTGLTLRSRFTAGTRSWPSLPGLSRPGGTPMTTTTLSTALATIQPVFTESERLALAGFLAGVA